MGRLVPGHPSINEGATGDGVLELTLPDDFDLDDYELIEEGKPYREWCVPEGSS